MMKAAVFDGEIQQIKSIPIPVPKENEILIKISACGVCHTDEGYLHGVSTYKKPPIILGHEASGTVVKVGVSSMKFEAEDHVLIPPVLTCGTCFYCLNSKETLCRNQQMLGNHIDGAFANYISVPAKDIIKLPKTLDLKSMSIVADAVATPFHAVYNQAKLSPGDTVVVLGTGGVGINVVQFSALIGCQVIAVDIQDDKLKLAKELGANTCFNANSVDVIAEIRKSYDRIDVVFEVIGHPETQNVGFNLLSPGGKLILVGYSPQPLPQLNTGKVMFRELEIIGSLGCPPRSFPRVIHLIQNNKIKIEPLISHEFPLDRINEAFEVLKSGKGLRMVIDMEST